MKQLKLTIEGNPVAQKRHRHHRWGVYDPSGTDKQKIVKTISKQSINLLYKKFYTEKPVYIQIYFHIQRPKSHFRTGKNSKLLKKSSPLFHIQKPDIDNYIKLYMDCLKNIWKDDSQVIKITSSKDWVEKNPFTEISVYEV